MAGAPSANFLQRSPLASWPVASSIPGLIGWFQVDTGGVFSTPLLPQADPGRYGIAGEELDQRRALAQQLQRILGENRLVTASDKVATSVGGKGAEAREGEGGKVREWDEPMAAEEELAFLDEDVSVDASLGITKPAAAPVPAPVAAQAAFDRLNVASARQAPNRKQDGIAGALGRVEELKLEQSFQSAPAPEPKRSILKLKKSQPEKRLRKERSVLPEAPASVIPTRGGRAVDEPSPSELRIRTFESEIDPFEFSLLDSGHFVLYRKVWRDGQRYIQGALIEQQPFLRGVVEPSFGSTALAQMSDLVVAFRDEVFATFSGRAPRSYQYRAEELEGELLYQTRLSAPLDGLELISSINRLPAGPGGTVSRSSRWERARTTSSRWRRAPRWSASDAG